MLVIKLLPPPHALTCRKVSEHLRYQATSLVTVGERRQIYAALVGGRATQGVFSGLVLPPKLTPAPLALLATPVPLIQRLGEGKVKRMIDERRILRRRCPPALVQLHRQPCARDRRAVAAPRQGAPRQLTVQLPHQEVRLRDPGITLERFADQLTHITHTAERPQAAFLACPQRHRRRLPEPRRGGCLIGPSSSFGRILDAPQPLDERVTLYLLGAILQLKLGELGTRAAPQHRRTFGLISRSMRFAALITLDRRDNRGVAVELVEPIELLQQPGEPAAGISPRRNPRYRRHQHNPEHQEQLSGKSHSTEFSHNQFACNHNLLFSNSVPTGLERATLKSMMSSLRDAFYRLLRGSRPETRSTATAGAKHLPFFKLTEACDSNQCPLCRLRQHALEAYLESLVYQGVNDRRFRAEFDRNRGFCPYHAHAFLAKQDRLAVVITHRQLVVEAIAETEQPAVSLRKRGALFDAQAANAGAAIAPAQPDAKSGPTRRCQICALLNDTELQHLRTLANYIDDEELRGYLERSAGLCLPHYRKLARLPCQIPAWLHTLQQSRLQEALAAVDEYINETNYTLSGNSVRLNEPHLRNLPNRLVGLLVGYAPDQDLGV